ncbi:MAG: ribosome assembly RNA-binding protein YhbY [Methylococcaceae bacterium]|nr:MAG: ribosome assembly RNA-binding protein YhbY [Methylococcaceae bacterium]
MTPKLKKALCAKAHTLKPVVITGQAGVSEAVLAEIDNALNHHELIKIRLRDDDREERKRLSMEVCERLNAELLQILGQIVTLYRKNPEKTQVVSKPVRRVPRKKPERRAAPSGRTGY